jgi:Leucine-rich repeat (LRR) protein
MNLTELNCSYTKIKTLPNLPNLIKLNCLGTKIKHSLVQ